MSRILKILFFGILVKPIILIGLGLNIRNRNDLPKNGPSILAANHNSHLDTLVLMSLYPLSQIHKVRPVAAADYFMKNKWLKWFSTQIIGIIPLERKSIRNLDILFKESREALQSGDILIVFPEGSRGMPEQLGTIKKGLFHLANTLDNISIIPIVLHGLGKSLPKGEALFVPFNCDVIIGKPLHLETTANDFVKTLSNTYSNLLELCLTRNTLD